VTAETATKHALINALLVVSSAALALVGVELALRCAGYPPWEFSKLDRNEPTTNVPDSVLGWRGKPGSYVIPPYKPGGDPIRMTILADGARSTGLEVGREGIELFFTGASLTQGWAISDHETFARKVQERFPELQVSNYGTSGYSTFQSLLSLEKLLAERSRPDWVFYGLSNVHEWRNVASPNWLRLLSMFSKRGLVRVPYCTLGKEGELTRHPPEGYPAWPLREHLATVATGERIYAESRGKTRSSQQRAVTEKLLLEMRELVESNRARFTIALLYFVDPLVKQGYAEFLRSNAIDAVDCAFPLTADMRVPGEVHPNGKLGPHRRNPVRVEFTPARRCPTP
jgi:hypothetical protein